MPAHPASGFPPYSWKGRNTRFACAIRTALARTLPLAAFFIDAQFPSLTAQLAVETTQHPNMCPSRIRTPASTTSGTPLRRSLPSRFACHRQAQLAWVNRPHHPLRRPPPQLQTAFHSPNAWSTWRRLFPPHLLMLFPVTAQSLLQMLILTWEPSLSMEAGAEVFFNVPRNSPKRFSTSTLFSVFTFPRARGHRYVLATTFAQCFILTQATSRTATTTLSHLVTSLEERFGCARLSMLRHRLHR